MFCASFQMNFAELFKHQFWVPTKSFLPSEAKEFAVKLGNINILWTAGNLC